MKVVVRALVDLGPELVLAPERYLAEASAGEGIPLSDLVTVRTEQAPPGVVLDTTHAKDGLLDVTGALRSPATAKSTKRAVHPGDVIVSRLRPYLRQIAFVHPAALAQAKRPLAVSSEFFVLAPRGDDPIAFLVPFLLGERAQSVLAAAQEGGHHPRVPRESLLALRVPAGLVATRNESSKAVVRALDEVYRANARWNALL
ncbi:MAG: hypothetical protein KIT84_14880 [Labilithrix sp.]|nr:hypothetical protein [Labilithrix sp.]MCW5812307.1 hypothetical protein [Labilithrix sp.]